MSEQQQQQHPLFQIISDGDDVDAFKQWVRRNPNVDIKTIVRYHGEFPLVIMRLVINLNRINIFEYLIRMRLYGINEIVDHDDLMTILHTAAICMRIDMVKIMIKHGVDPNIQNRQGWTALWYLLALDRPGLYDTIKQLIAHGANVNITDNNGKSALFYAAEHMYDYDSLEPVMDILIDHGADMSIKDKNGKTVVDYARENRYAFRYFLKRHEVFDISHDELIAAFLFNVRLGNHYIVELLLKRFGDVLTQIIFTTNDHDKTLLDHLNDGFVRQCNDRAMTVEKHTEYNITFQILRDAMKNELKKRLTLQQLCFAQCICDEANMSAVPNYIVQENRDFLLSNHIDAVKDDHVFPDIIMNAKRIMNTKKHSRSDD